MRNLVHVACLVGACADALGAQAQTPGFFVETRITTVSRGGSNATTRTRVTRAWSSAACSRTEGESYRGDSTAYHLVTGRPWKSFHVVPRDRVVYVMDSAGSSSLSAEIRSTLGPMPSVGGITSLGNGGVILGHRTRKYEFRSTTRSTTGGVERTRAPTVTTYWRADDPKDPMVVAYRARRPAPGAGEPVATSAGMLLRTETHRQWLRDVTEVTTREVTVWRAEDVPASRCAIPAGYRTIDLVDDLRAQRSATAELRRLSQSANPADRVRARALGDSLFKEIRRTSPPARSLRDDPQAVIINGTAKKKP